MCASCSFCLSEFSTRFHALPLGDERKQEFISMLLPHLETENLKIIAERQVVVDFFDVFLWNLHKKLQSPEFYHIVALAKRYRIKKLFWRDEFLRRIDIIPISLALSQAALESGWGSSVYSRRYNNLFGEYTMHSSVPSRRIAGSKRRIRIFPSIRHAVEAYMWNLNTHMAYQDFRNERFLAHVKGTGYTGLEALEFLLAYSEIREEYAQKVALLMSKNFFERLDWQFYQHNHFVVSKTQRLKELLPHTKAQFNIIQSMQHNQ